MNATSVRAFVKERFIAATAAVLARAKAPGELLARIAERVDAQRIGNGGFADLRAAHTGVAYLSPADLARTETPIRRVLIVGSCMAEQLARALPVPNDFVLTNALNELPLQPPQPLDAYDLQIVQLPLRVVVPDAHLWRIAHDDAAAYERAFAVSVERMRTVLAFSCAWNRRCGLLTFVSNFLVPQQNPMGRLMPRYDLRNPAHFVERLNAELETELRAYENVYLLDADGVAAVTGRKYVGDDAVDFVGHGGLLADIPHNARDAERIEPVPLLTEHYDIATDAFLRAAWREVVAMVRTLRRVDEVKLVIVDLDDTLWRGVAADADERSNEAVEGWPLGVVEALATLKNRGVLLAIVSKNDEARIATVWDELIGWRLRLDDFALRRINWQPKVENVADILATVNLLPRSVVFIDDNPAERAAVAEAFPGIRTLGKYPYYLRRVLLWSPELQVATVTAESARRTEMVRAQAEREAERARFSRADFLRSLELRVELFEVTGERDPAFARVHELINKTNQFNTTGRRWTAPELRDALAAGARIVAFAARDRFSDYGTVGAVIRNGAEIVQFVMSCRVIGLDVEEAVMATVLAQLAAGGHVTAFATLRETDANFVCRELYARCGFASDGEVWSRATAGGGTVPAHVAVEERKSILA